MPEATTPATELTAQYISPVASDLECNVKEQERISSEITTLQQQLSALQHEPHRAGADATGTGRRGNGP